MADEHGAEEAASRIAGAVREGTAGGTTETTETREAVGHPRADVFSLAPPWTAATAALAKIEVQGKQQEERLWQALLDGLGRPPQPRLQGKELGRVTSMLKARLRTTADMAACPAAIRAFCVQEGLLLARWPWLGQCTYRSGHDAEFAVYAPPKCAMALATDAKCPMLKTMDSALLAVVHGFPEQPWVREETEEEKKNEETGNGKGNGKATVVLPFLGDDIKAGPFWWLGSWETMPWLPRVTRVLLHLSRSVPGKAHPWMVQRFAALALTHFRQAAAWTPPGQSLDASRWTTEYMPTFARRLHERTTETLVSLLRALPDTHLRVALNSCLQARHLTHPHTPAALLANSLLWWTAHSMRNLGSASPWYYSSHVDMGCAPGLLVRVDARRQNEGGDRDGAGGVTRTTWVVSERRLLLAPARLAIAAMRADVRGFGVSYSDAFKDALVTLGVPRAIVATAKACFLLPPAWRLPDRGRGGAPGVPGEGERKEDADGSAKERGAGQEAAVDANVNPGASTAAAAGADEDVAATKLASGHEWYACGDIVARADPTRARLGYLATLLTPAPSHWCGAMWHNELSKHRALLKCGSIAHRLGRKGAVTESHERYFARHAAAYGTLAQLQADYPRLLELQALSHRRRHLPFQEVMRELRETDLHNVFVKGILPEVMRVTPWLPGSASPPPSVETGAVFPSHAVFPFPGGASFRHPHDQGPAAFRVRGTIAK